MKKEYKCSICNKEFPERKTIKIGLQGTDSNLWPTVCLYCDKRGIEKRIEHLKKDSSPLPLIQKLIDNNIQYEEELLNALDERIKEVENDKKNVT